MNVRKQHFLICAEIMIKGEMGISAQKANGVLIQNDIKVNAMGIGKAQQAVQIAFMSKLPEEVHDQIEIIDVIVISITHLGEFTQEEWSHVPANLQLVKPDEFKADPEKSIDDLAAAEDVEVSRAKLKAAQEALAAKQAEIDLAEVQSDRA